MAKHKASVLFLASSVLLACVSQAQEDIATFPTPKYDFKGPILNERGKLRTVKGDVLYPVTTGYDLARRPWQTFFSCNAYPAVIVRPEDVNDVKLALEYAKVNNLRVTVRNGGHSYAGISRSYGLVLDMSYINKTSMTSAEADGLPLVRVEAGSTNIGVYYDLAKYNLTLPAGGCPSVGISGLTLGGGFGVLSRKWGLASDQVYSIDAVVYEDQSYKAVTATADNQYSDLFFAFRGGMGGNYGVVTSWMYRAHRIRNVYTSTFNLNLTEGRIPNHNNDPNEYKNIRTAISRFMQWCDAISSNTNCEMSISTMTVPSINLQPVAAADAQYAKVFKLESYCVCEELNCSLCIGEVSQLEGLLANAPVYNRTSSPEEGIPWSEFIWEIANCTRYYEAVKLPGQYPPSSLVRTCIAHRQAPIGRGRHNRKKSLFLSSNPDQAVIQDVLLWMDSFADNIIVDNYTAANIEFYYWGGALASRPSYAVDSAWRHRSQKWLVHITGRFPDEASPKTIGTVYFALGKLHTSLLKAEQSLAEAPVQDYQNFADASLSYEAWSHFYFDGPTIQRLSEINYKYNPNDIFRNELSVPLSTLTCPIFTSSPVKSNTVTPGNTATTPQGNQGDNCDKSAPSDRGLIRAALAFSVIGVLLLVIFGIVYCKGKC
ncbi:uncharacterized protein LOC135830761 [Sycon ciliatum]|uniref:uncharacterized protein LOC135830761 n=1 Tax=Sycon ciliatum TaxID=27933 RepID=UPI0031F709B8